MSDLTDALQLIQFNTGQIRRYETINRANEEKIASAIKALLPHFEEASVKPLHNIFKIDLDLCLTWMDTKEGVVRYFIRFDDSFTTSVESSTIKTKQKELQQMVSKNLAHILPESNLKIDFAYDTRM
jgi:hypothetical protein